MQEMGRYDVIVAGAGVTGIVASIAAAREGARTLLIEGSANLGGLITGGRLTKPTGVVQPGVYLDLINRAAAYGGADASIRTTHWGSYSGIFDAEVMQRVIIETLKEEDVATLLYAPITGALKEQDKVTGVELHTKMGPGLALAQSFVDTTGDGDLAALAGAKYMFGRPGDGLTQPMTSYFRIANVDVRALADDCIAHESEMMDLVTPTDHSESDSAITMNEFFCRGFVDRIAQARAEGFPWILPKRHVTLKTGMMPGEINVNATRVHGNALDPWERSNATIEVRQQAYCVFDFLKQYVKGFEGASLLEVSGVLGVRETRRITGHYIITEDDVRSNARFPDAIGLCTDPIDIHEPGGEGGQMENVGTGYGIPFRALVPEGVENLTVAGRCVSVDAVAYGSMRNTPACGLTGQAAGTAAALSSDRSVSPSSIDVKDIQARLEATGVVLGTSEADRMPM